MLRIILHVLLKAAHFTVAIFQVEPVYRLR
jgi:hypothetical protein